MELPSDILIHNDLLGMKGTRGRLLQIAEGYYEVVYRFGGQIHRVLLPIGQTAIIRSEPEPESGETIEIER